MYIYTDQGREFQSGLIKELGAILQIGKTRNSPYDIDPKVMALLKGLIVLVWIC